MQNKTTVKEVPISEAYQNKGKKLQTILGVIDSVMQTTGPTLFTVSDGSGTIVIKAFDGPGVRAYPEIKEDDAVQVMMSLKEFNNSFEGEAMRMQKLDEVSKKNLVKRMGELERERAKVVPVPFLINSPILDKLKPSFIKAAEEIRLAVIKNRPIIVRHHNDADGYSSGYALERGILPLVEQQHGTGKAKWTFFSRAPSMTPFYEIEDSIKDAAQSLSDEAKFSEKIPLVIIADTGSSHESLLAIEQGRVHGIDFIVIDHHYFEQDVISDKVLVHINPFLVKEDGSSYSAGMLCSELARFIGPAEGVEFIPAMAGMADMIKNPDAMKAYIEIAQKKGYTPELLANISSVIDFVSTKLRFMEAREYVGRMFGEPIADQKKLVGLLAPYIEKLEKKGLAIAKMVSKKEEIGKITLQSIAIEEAFSRNAYPKPGRSVGLLHDEECKKGNKGVVTIGLMSDGIIFRANEESGFSVHDFITHLNKELAQAFVEGGGHHGAGSIRFVPMKQKEVLQILKKFLEKL